MGATSACRLEEYQLTGADGCRSHRQWWRCGSAGRESWRLRPNRSGKKKAAGGASFRIWLLSARAVRSSAVGGRRFLRGCHEAKRRPRPRRLGRRGGRAACISSSAAATKWIIVPGHEFAVIAVPWGCRGLERGRSMASLPGACNGSTLQTDASVTIRPPMLIPAQRVSSHLS